ncbi:MAG: hypothetical protein IPL31_02015 [Saprospiraceae bacterium]|nr:hypothetical protein [Saprospiraceae bacterium]
MIRINNSILVVLEILVFEVRNYEQLPNPGTSYSSKFSAHNFSTAHSPFAASFWFNDLCRYIRVHANIIDQPKIIQPVLSGNEIRRVTRFIRMLNSPPNCS